MWSGKLSKNKVDLINFVRGYSCRDVFFLQSDISFYQFEYFEWQSPDEVVHIITPANYICLPDGQFRLVKSLACNGNLS